MALEEEHAVESFDGVDIALFSAGGSISRKFGPLAAERGTVVVVVVDNSSAFRMADGVPLRMVVSTYQAASGAGAAAMEELMLQTRELVELQLLKSSSELLRDSMLEEIEREFEAAERQKMLEDMERDFKDSQHTLPTCSRYKRS
ncbi:hypothetical protein DY000_02015995 [Brassica cretica]|uniref:Semialdehyde dehydrogenase NAD-binding domain-containing protein n=1 Tax=Brassica cretica TaxID=69181 RepID=A0ABQ7D9A3_BRACR|nr:hypothetical protein DY000_02015995 [Brassica cretica]